MNSQRLRSRRTLMGLALASALALGSFGAARAARGGSVNPPATLKMADPHEGPSRNTFAPVVKRVLPSVVNVSSSKVIKTQGFQGGMPDDMFQRFFGDDPFNGNGRRFRGNNGRNFGMPQERRAHGLGSGVIVSPEGYILTNNHVVDGATEVTVGLNDKREFRARVVGADPKSDIAVLKIDASNLQYITIGDSSTVQVGDQVLAIGNPFGVGQTVTMGIVSAMERGGLGIEDYEDFIQTDAPINPGNSGGALINDRGELIGINTAILAHGSEGNQGIGFAVPVNLARQVMMAIVQNGKVVRAYLGVMTQDITPAMAKAFHTPNSRGALVSDVSANSPAERAGLQKGDIIREVDGKPVENSNQLRNRINMLPPETHVSLQVDRNGSLRSVAATLGELEARQERASAEPNSDQSLDGVAVDTLTPEIARELRLSPRTKGVVVTEVAPGSKAEEAGLRRGDVIQEVNRKPVQSRQQFESAVRSAGENALLLVNRDGNTLFLTA